MRGALISALKLLHFCPGAKIIVATDKPGIFDGYPIETLELTGEQKDRMSFGRRYDFGIKAASLIELLKRSDRLLLMDTDMYPVADISRGFQRISPTHSLMWRREGRKQPYRSLAGKGIRIGDYTLTGHETMWASGIASAEAIDNSFKMTLGRRYSVTGPIESADMGGPDIMHMFAEFLQPAIDRSEHPPKEIGDLVRAGNLGLKSGKGVYDWSQRDGPALLRARAERLFQHMAEDAANG